MFVVDAVVTVFCVLCVFVLCCFVLVCFPGRVLCVLMCCVAVAGDCFVVVLVSCAAVALLLCCFAAFA